MIRQKVMFSPVTRLSGLLSVEVTMDRGRVVEANASGTMFRGFEWIMRDRKVTDAVYLTQRICGICSLAHGAIASYLLDEIYNNEITENAQLLRNIMFGADVMQNHIRHFYLFSLPDFVKLPNTPPFQSQNLTDARLHPQDNQRLVDHYFKAAIIAQKCHETMALFGGKAPHQHSFVHGGVSVAPTADKVSRARALMSEVQEFVKGSMLPDTELIARVYKDYYKIGQTAKRLLSFGMFRFGPKNNQCLWQGGVLADGQISIPQVQLVSEDITSAWYNPGQGGLSQEEPNPCKPGAYTFIKSVFYGSEHFQVGPLARMAINGLYQGGTSTMDRIYARSLETLFISEFIEEWLHRLEPGPPPIWQKEIPIKQEAIVATDVMRGALIHRCRLSAEEQVAEYNIITPTVWNFSPKDRLGMRGPVEAALVGTEILRPDMLYTVLGRIVRSFDPCINCATHVIEAGASPGNGLTLSPTTWSRK